MFTQLGTVFVLGLGFALGYIFCENERARSEDKMLLHDLLRKDKSNGDN